MHAVIYCRTATIGFLQDVREHPAIIDQLRRCQAHATRAGYDVREVIVDVCSGRVIARPQLDAWIEDHLNDAAVVVTASADRLGRTGETIAAITARLLRHGLIVEYAADEVSS